MSNTKHSDSGPVEGARRATDAGPESGRAGKGRWSAKRKMSVALELLRGADLESASRKHGVTAATLSPVAQGLPGGRRGGAQDPAGGSGRRAGPPDEIRHRRAGDGERAAAATHPAHGGREAFSAVEVEAMSRTRSASTGRCYGRPSGAQGVGPAAVDVLPAAAPRGLASSARQARPEDALHG